MTLGRVFVDTGAWFAVQVADDEHHHAFAFDVHFRIAGFSRIPVDARLSR